MFRISYNFCTQMTFENGLTVSFAIGEGNYCSNKNPNENPYINMKKERESNNCEVIVFDSNGDLDIQQFLPEGVRGDGSKCAGWITPDVLVKVMNNVANWKE